MFLVFPYQADVPMQRWPIANFALIGATAALFVLTHGGFVPVEVIEAMVLDGWSPVGMVGSLFLHGDILHLAGNMAFLWVFGNAVCAKVGNLAYALIYLGLGLAGGTVHNLLDGSPAIGASDAINGVVGMFLVLYPRNEVSCAYWFIIRFGAFDVDSRVLILIWFAFDIWGALSGMGNVAYWAHIGGFVGGFATATALLASGRVRMTELEESLYDQLGVPPEQLVEKLTATVRGTAEGAAESPPTDAEPDGADDPAPPPPTDPQPFIRVTCRCGKKLKIHPRFAGRRGNCPACSGQIEIPVPSDQTQP